MKTPVTPQKVQSLEVIRAWVIAHQVEFFINALLSDESFQTYLSPHAWLHYAKRFISMEQVGHQDRKYSPCRPVKGKGKKPKRSSSIKPGSHDNIIRPPRQSSNGVFV